MGINSTVSFCAADQHLHMLLQTYGPNRVHKGPLSISGQGFCLCVSLELVWSLDQGLGKQINLPDGEICRILARGPQARKNTNAKDELAAAAAGMPAEVQPQALRPPPPRRQRSTGHSSLWCRFRWLALKKRVPLALKNMITNETSGLCILLCKVTTCYVV